MEKVLWWKQASSYRVASHPESAFNFLSSRVRNAKRKKNAKQKRNFMNRNKARFMHSASRNAKIYFGLCITKRASAEMSDNPDENDNSL